MGLTGGTTTSLALKKAASSEPFDTDWAADFNTNLDDIDSAIGDAQGDISDLQSDKANLSGATFTGEMAIARIGGNPGSLSIKGDGNTYNFAQVSLESDEGTDKAWTIIHRKHTDFPNGLILQYFDGSNYYDQAVLKADGTLQLIGGIQMPEISDPSAPSGNNGILYVRDNGSSKSQLCVRFPSGAVQVLATEP